MEKKSGIARNVRTTISVSGGGNDTAVTTTHIATFQLDNLAVKASSSEPVMINEGDRVTVAGTMRRGVLCAHAYSNETFRAQGNEGWVAGAIGGPILGLVGLGILIFGGSHLVTVGIGIIFLLAGVYTLHVGLRTFRAIGML